MARGNLFAGPPATTDDLDMHLDDHDTQDRREYARTTCIARKW